MLLWKRGELVLRCSPSRPARMLEPWLLEFTRGGQKVEDVWCSEKLRIKIEKAIWQDKQVKNGGLETFLEVLPSWPRDLVQMVFSFMCTDANLLRACREGGWATTSIGKQIDLCKGGCLNAINDFSLNPS